MNRNESNSEKVVESEFTGYKNNHNDYDSFSESSVELNQEPKTDTIRTSAFSHNPVSVRISTCPKQRTLTDLELKFYVVRYLYNVEAPKNGHDIQFNFIRGHNVPADLIAHSVRPERFSKILEELCYTNDIESISISEHRDVYQITERGKDFYRKHFDPDLMSFIETVYFPYSIKESIDRTIDIH